MKKFKITMIATSVKEVFLSAKNKEEALTKVDKLYLDDEKINFDDNDIRNLNLKCKEIQSVRREKFTATDDELNDCKDDLINAFLDTFQKAEKKVSKDGFLNMKLTKEDINYVTKLYNEYKANCN